MSEAQWLEMSVAQGGDECRSLVRDESCSMVRDECSSMVRNECS